MQLSTLRYFYKVSRSRSIREAAEQLHISASAVSRKIAELEHEFGQALFERHARGMRLTEAGEIVQQHFAQILLTVDTVHEQLNELKGLFRGRVRVASVEGAVAHLLMGAIASLHRDYPQISFELMTASASGAVDAVLLDAADLMIAFNVPPNAKISIVASSEVPLYAVVGTTHALKRARVVSLRDVASAPAGYLTEAHGARMLLDNALNKLGVTPHRMLVTNSIESLKAFVRHGIGMTLLPAFVVEREVRAGEFFLVPVAERELVSAPVIIGVRRGRQLSRGTQELAARLKDLLARPPKNVLSPARRR